MWPCTGLFRREFSKEPMSFFPGKDRDDAVEKTKSLKSSSQNYHAKKVCSKPPTRKMFFVTGFCF